ncbi:MAG: methyltransferase [Rhodospirillaceae bacterium]|jgi:tRNA1(Val) A37 N6-methylase TrmN6|nr:methyltransferase [Rhodospirillaceae bacterium]
METTDDALLAGQVRLIQPKDGFRAAIDTVLLAAAVPAMAGDRVIEIGSGCGAAALCLARRVEGVQVTGIEIQQPLVRLAGDNIRLNGLEGRVEIMAGNVAGPLPPRVQGPFDYAMLNPPYLDAARSRPPPDGAKAVAHMEATEEGLETWIKQVHGLLRHKGIVTLVHRADRLDDVMACLRGRFAGITVFPLWPRAGEAAKRVLIRARKGVATPLTLSAGLTLHEAGGEFTAAADAVLRGGALEY